MVEVYRGINRMSIAQTSLLAQYAPYEDPDTHTVLFVRTIFRGIPEGPPTHRYFRYDTKTCTLYRVYAKDKKSIMHHLRNQNTEVAIKLYIDVYRMLPVWPPHLKVDIGL